MNRICNFVFVLLRTAKKQYQKFETNIPRKGIERPQSQVPHSCVCERFICIFPQSVCLFCCRKICGLILGIFAHKHMNVEIWTEAHINGIFVKVGSLALVMRLPIQTMFGEMRNNCNLLFTLQRVFTKMLTALRSKHLHHAY